MIDPSSLKVTELKTELKKYGLPVGGLKKELVERLTEHLEKLSAPDEAEEEDEPEEASPSPEAGSESHTEAGDDGSSPAAQVETVQATKVVDETPIVQDEIATNAEDSSMTVDEDEGQKVEPEESKESLQETAKDDDTAMNDAPEAEAVGVKPVEQIEGEEITKEMIENQLPEIIEPTQESSVQQPTVETAAPSPLPLADVPKSPNRVMEPTTNAPTPLRDEGQEQDDDVPKVVPEASTMSMDTDMETDLRLRKKRSRTPSMTKDEVELKKAKIQEDTTASGQPPVVFENELGVEGEKQVEDEVLEDAAPVEVDDKDDTNRRQSRSRSPSQKESKRQRDEQSHSRSVSRSRSRSRSRSYRSRTRSRSRSRSRSQSSYSRKRPSIVAAKDDVRFKDLFNQNETSATSTTNKDKDTTSTSLLARETNTTAAKANDSDEDIEPATHPATRALYIRDLVRPLQEAQLRNHLISLASRSSSEDDDHDHGDVLKVLHLDSIKTHCFAIFDSVKSCSRARNGIHGKIWPNEKNRKVLFADFVPEDKVDSWIQLEKVERHRRFHVVYRQSDDDGDGRVEAVLDDVSGSGAGGGVLMGMTQPGSGAGRASISSSSAAVASVGGGNSAVATLRGTGVGPPIDAPSGPRHPNSSGRLMRQDSLQNSSSGNGGGNKDGNGPVGGGGSSSSAAAGTGTGTGPRVVSLEDLFLFTKTKPRLYYKPVDEAIAKERLSSGNVGRQQSQSQSKGNQYAASGRDYNRNSGNSAGAGGGGGASGGDSYYGVAYRGDRNRDRRDRRGRGGGAVGGVRGDRGRGGAVGKGDSWTGKDRNWDRAWVRDGGRSEKSRNFRDRDAGRSRSRSRDRR